MTFSTSYLTARETDIWDLRRKGHTKSEIGRILRITRQAAYRILGIIDDKVELAFTEVAKTNSLEVKRINVVDGIMEAYSPAYNIPVFVSFSKINGLRVWYLHEGNCGECVQEKSCRDFLESEVKERGIELTEEDLRLSPTRLVLKVFERYMGGS